MEFLFADDDPVMPDKAAASRNAPTWKMLVVDDDPEVVAVTRLALSGFEFLGRKVEILSAHSGIEGREIFNREPEIAVALIDVVMESEDAGLKLVEYIRVQCANHTTRVYLRTGQPGHAPVDRVIREYDIDDYKEKTELTAQKLRTLLYSGLRAYRDITTISRQRDGMRRVILATSDILRTGSLREFASAVLGQLTDLLGLNDSAIYCLVLPASDKSPRAARTLAASGSLVEFADQGDLESLPPAISARFKEALQRRESLHGEHDYVLYHRNHSGQENLLYVELKTEIGVHERELLELYAINVSLTFENLTVLEELQAAQGEVVSLLGDAVEQRRAPSAAHVERVARISHALALSIGLDERAARMILHAAPLHDVGKIAIDDAILLKPGTLDPEEWAAMKTHAVVGAELLARSDREVMQIAAQIARSHHEHWDGSGYPAGLAGEAIPLVGRIVALADAFDSLSTARPYRTRWPDEEIRSYLEAQSGKRFDPRLVAALLGDFGRFVAIRERFPDA
ncbi:DUF3369 domain-containing protein [Niveibacterium umoris]|uniref:Response regulator RpfG family c-di-GMP phosphodiesterase n=1 Tax=Niveibacterium umoris TaxID=1193620 RepID=A0A840BKK5_9RHOO|nr:DUF3369 domain-containing protein [Niveibacterium umoris]MBB4012152.1 response regulator RpfG family c-di-GMP phosphodiesterase [Niveibacterium umoris]